jgi:adenylate cyclase
VLVSFLDQVFSAFDEIAVKYGLERLKTIGDAFMAVGGVPTANRTHAMDACLAALEMQRAIRLLNERRGKLRLPTLELRVGIHSGPVMAGIVGKRKFTYDIWGDAVNLAARLESASEPRRTNVSSAVVGQLSAFFSFTPRGRVEVKNKDPLEMFFLDRIRPEFAADALGEAPNEALLRQRTQLGEATMGTNGFTG